MPVVTDPVTMSPANLIADAAYPLLSETIEIDAPMYLGSIISMDPATRIGSLASQANMANVFGVLRDHVMRPGTLAVVYVSGSFIAETLKSDPSAPVEALIPRLRELGIYARPSVHYPSDPLPGQPLPPVP